MGIDRETLEQLRHLLRPFLTRMVNMVVRGTVQLVDDSTGQQGLQVGGYVGGPNDGAEHWQPYGFSSVPLAGAEHVTIFPHGDRSHPLVLQVSDRRYRPTGGQPGEVTVYNSAGAKITMTKDGDIVAEPASGRQVLLGGAAASDGAVMGNQRDTAEQTFLTALTAYVTAIKPITDPTNTATPVINAAITAFKSAITAAISATVKLQ